MPLQSPPERRMWPCDMCNQEWPSRLAAAECCESDGDG